MKTQIEEKTTRSRKTRSTNESPADAKPKKTRARKSADTQSSSVKKTSSNVQKPKSISPFDIIGMMFRNTGEFESLSKFVLERNLFMINRTCAIAYPLQAQWFNRLGISGPSVIRAWRDFLLRQHGYGRVPYFVYTKGSKSTQDKAMAESPLKDFTKDDIYAYCSHYQISQRDFDDLLYFSPDNLVRHMHQFCNITTGKHAIEKAKTKSQK